MDTVVDTADEDAAVEDIEVEAIVEMANQDVDVAAIEDVATHKQQCSNCLFADPKSYWTNLGFPSLYQKLSTLCYFGFMRVKNKHTFIHFGEFSLLTWEIISENWTWFHFLCACLFFLFLLQLVPSGSRTRMKKTISYEYDQTFLGFGWRLSELILRYERMDWYQNYVFFSALLLAWRFDTWVAERTINGVERVECTERLAGYCLLALFYGLDMVGLGA